MQRGILSLKQQDETLGVVTKQPGRTMEIRCGSVAHGTVVRTRGGTAAVRTTRLRDNHDDGQLRRPARVKRGRLGEHCDPRPARLEDRRDSHTGPSLSAGAGRHPNKRPRLSDHRLKTTPVRTGGVGSGLCIGISSLR
jgi:hypothetical protein